MGSGHPAPGRRARAVAAAAVLAVVASATTAAGHAEVYAAPAPLPALSAAALDARYQAVDAEIARARATALRVRDRGRARALAAFLAPGRRFLAFDARGRGRAVEVLGDLARADRIAVVVPGADTALANFDSPKFVGGGSRALYRQARADAPGERIAVIAWLGYRAPRTLSPEVLTSGPAADGARALGRFLTGVRAANGRARIALLCHSYGSVVCGKAARHLAPAPVDEIALFGSPGVTAHRASDLGTSARVWAGRAGGDWMEYVPNVRFAGIGFGADPASPEFGARRFDAGTGPHSAYLKPGTVALRNLALIALGRDAQVAPA
ncbi:alpha/beta hydrolase [Actinomadura opuntiae]|uniref:alpha/beta hydrolase n=1 Tax=Actinomadura sp. OS1-43 TaxID=604315 RepID=UPI00255AF64D|nr:alpha/beta hydrolase [Actinomadura sp. OS1-43]MDL4815927.1 alpha/beta hydrolase [Actinomadura sp. OS1-43]